MAKMWEFDAFLEDGDKGFASYVERFEHYCEVANVQEEKLKKSAFITAIGKKAYKTLKDLLLPATPAEKGLEDLVKVLSDHYEPASRIIAERFRLNRRYQAEDLWKQLVNPPPLTPSTVKLKTYGGAPLEVKGQAEVPVEYNGQRKILLVVVVPGNKPALLGRDWIENLDVDLNGIHMVQAELTADNLVKSAPAVFQAIMDELLKGLCGVVCYLDDVLITGANYNECLTRVEAVLQHFEKHGVKPEVLKLLYEGHPVFLRSNAVQHVKTPPYHPASNGAAERLVQTVKKNLVRQLRDERRSGQARTIQHRLDQFLFTCRNTPCSTTGKTPAQSFVSWAPGRVSAFCTLN
ncbi:uncharacterized protein LOC119456559 [Dermacentor silvarum]|uniref:uncharacterized protein LOC119456559 n=1 Tax=Dermacentor silvarum TaxID=543639 RepID=UPI00189AC7FF|nr:uncharacterized protein LOC119456559 [Dermacentor silvarum]